MTVGELKQIIEQRSLPDHAPVLVPGSDHSYNTVTACDEFATCFGMGRNREYSEYYDDATLGKSERKVPALILRR